MAETQELTYADVLQHSTKKDLYMVIHDKVYNASSFVDEHPGGEEVLLDVAGQDGTQAFEDVGHSDEAREILEGLLIGKLNRLPGDPIPSASVSAEASLLASNSASGGVSVGLYAFLLLGIGAAFGAYKYLEAQKSQ